ncbi:MAG: ABC transporter substrate-binding protein [Acutalibacteraceae bacterium]
MKKLIALLLCFSLILSVFSGCKSKEENRTDETTDVSAEAETETTQQTQKSENRKISLSYNAKQSFNPFKTESTTNKNIATLLYDSLFCLDSSYNAKPLLAETYRLEKKTLTVTLNDELYFSDGSPLTVSDVLASFKAAKTSPVYSSRLKIFTSAAVGQEANSIRFALNQENIYAVNCLDFPVAKSGTTENNIPVGSGRYTLKKSGGAYVLSANTQNTRNEELEQSKIYLSPADAESGELYQLQIGDISFMFDDMSLKSQRKQISAGTAEIPMNTIVYLGFNNSGELFSNSKLKNAVEAAIDFSTVCASAYNSLLKPCATVFNPDWSAVSAFSSQTPKRQAALAEQLLEECGYVYAYENNEFRSKNFDFIEMTILVNSESTLKQKAAKLIAADLKTVGIDAEVEAVEFDEYKEKLSKGEFDLYVGEIKLTSDMNLSPFFSENGEASYTIDPDSTVAKAYSDFAAGKIDVSTFDKVFDEYKPFIPLGYRYGIAYYSRELRYEGTVSENDIFANIYSWSFS